MEPESSLPYSQVFATYPYPEPAPCNPHNPLPNKWGTLTKNWKWIMDTAIATGLSNSRSYLKSVLPYDATERKITGYSRVVFIFVSVRNVRNSAKEVRNTENKLWWCDQWHHLRERVIVKFFCVQSLCNDGTWDLKNPGPWCYATCSWKVHDSNLCKAVSNSGRFCGFSCSFKPMQEMYLRPRPSPPKVLLNNYPKIWHHIVRVT
jgi:hypothetical protein